MGPPFFGLILEMIDDYILYVDGASRGNPGDAGIGFCLEKNGTVIVKDGYYIGRKTNNHAEYLSLLVSIIKIKFFLKKNGIKKLLVKSDSLLLVKQMNGFFKIKNEIIKNCHEAYIKINSDICLGFEHVFRENNVIADLMANRGIDEKKELSKDIIDFFNRFNCW